ncbi:MAG: 30S ribosomal protein S19e [Candidatus Micrarchaeia archaeon]
MANAYEADTTKLIKEIAEQLKGMINKPEYIKYVKSGAGRERPPEDPDFWYIRSASILRWIYLKGPVGVSRLRAKYSSKKQHVVHRMHGVKAGGSIITDAMNELEKAKLVKKTKQGRVITPEGRSFVDKIANKLSDKK